MRRQVFLGGAAGETTWRQRIAIPALAAAGVTFYDPQLGVGEWTEQHEAAEMLAKDAADVLLFVINGETRGVATVAEVAYYLGTGRRLALVVHDIPPGAIVRGQALTEAESEDLNRGRIFLRTMARAHGVPVFAEIAEATAHAIELARRCVEPLTLEAVRQVLAEVSFGNCHYHAEPVDTGFLIQIRATEPDAATGQPEAFEGRHWHLSPDATRADVVRTALKAALAWQEHETRERFTYRGKPIFGPHLDPDALLPACPP